MNWASYADGKGNAENLPDSKGREHPQCSGVCTRALWKVFFFSIRAGKTS